jgi:hypothetical protein
VLGVGSFAVDGFAGLNFLPGVALGQIGDPGAFFGRVDVENGASNFTAE